MSDDRIYSVNEVVDAVDKLHGHSVRIVGALHLEFEGDCISHLPAAERRPDEESSLWASFDLKAMGCEASQLAQFNHRHVVVTATVDREFTGHFGLWPGSIMVTSIVKNKSK